MNEVRVGAVVIETVDGKANVCILVTVVCTGVYGKHRDGGANALYCATQC